VSNRASVATNTGSSPKAAERLIFANQLRGLAALIVLASHLIGQYWGARDFAALATCTPVQPGVPPPVYALVANPWLQPGPFGVALFFLISGLVIPFSLERTSGSRFLLARLLRIYPTYWMALLVSICLLHADATLWDHVFPYGWRTIFANVLLIHEVTGDPSIDLVNWTLCVELKFYLLMALAYRFIQKWPASTILILSGLLAATRRQDGIDLILMLGGTLFHLRHHERISRITLALCCCGLAVLFARGIQPPVLAYSYGFAALLFTLLFVFRRYAIPSRLLDGLAAISYPLYLVHFIAGFAVVKFLTLRLHLPYELSLIAALFLIITLAALLHYMIELPTIALGRQITRR